MSVFKCKMCGGTIEFEPGSTVGVCDHCGTKQTLPRLDDDRKANLYDRADHFRRNNDYDKAAGIYESLLNEDKTDAEAYWLLVLCRYGVEYVEDPATRKRIPTVNRVQFTSIFDDADYRSALQYADGQQRTIYESEAAAINEIQKGILAISQKEEPFDVFICYKETDAQGRRTPDSVLATDLYHQLVNEGFKVFFSRITLEDKLGTAYEPYIFAALNSAKVMVVLGTKPEYFNAVWVKNEWSRYLALVKASNGKKILIPAYRDMDPYDLPEEFSHLQAQDMSKLGYMQDLIYGIKKILGSLEDRKTVPSRDRNMPDAQVLIDRAFLFIEDGNHEKAASCLEQALNADPKNPMIYVGKLLIETGCRRMEDWTKSPTPFDQSQNYERAIRFADARLKKELEEYAVRTALNKLKEIYDSAVSKMNSGTTAKDFIQAKQLFESVADFQDAKKLAESCDQKAETARQEEVYSYAVRLMNSVGAKKLTDLNNAANALRSIKGFKDANEKILECEQKITAETEAVAKKRQRKKRAILIASAALVLLVVFGTLWVKVISPFRTYRKGMSMIENGDYSKAQVVFEALDNYKDSPEMVKECIYLYAISLRNDKNWEEANRLFNQIKDYKDSASLIHEHEFLITNSTDPTCEGTGIVHYQCATCNFVYTETKPALGHSYKVVDSKEPTCETAGNKSYQCERCGNAFSETVPILGHTYTNATCTEPKKCSRCGKTEGSPLGHTTDGTKCSRCGLSTFEPIKYSGVGDKIISNISLPEGSFVIRLEASISQHEYILVTSLVVNLYDGNGNIPAYLSGNLREENGFAISEQKMLEGPLNNGRLEIDTYNDISWTVTIEAI